MTTGAGPAAAAAGFRVTSQVQGFLFKLAAAGPSRSRPTVTFHVKPEPAGVWPPHWRRSESPRRRPPGFTVTVSGAAPARVKTNCQKCTTKDNLQICKFSKSPEIKQYVPDT